MNKELLLIANTVNVKGVPEVIEILPLGNVVSRKGNFIVDKIAFNEMYQYFKERQLDIVVDYEHQTLEGAEAPAAGWVKELKLTEHGVAAKVEWTPKAKNYLANKEYRYLSPVILKRKEDNRAVRLHSIALTNTPAIDGMKPIINSLKDNEKQDNNEEVMNEMEALKKIAGVLGLDENATLDEVLQVIEELKSQKEDNETLANKLLMDMKGQKVEDLIQMALSEGKILPYQRKWAEQLALKDYDGFKEYIEKAPQVVPLYEVGILKDDKKDMFSSTGSASSEVSKMLGITDEDIKKYGK